MEEVTVSAAAAGLAAALIIVVATLLRRFEDEGEGEKSWCDSFVSIYVR